MSLNIQDISILCNPEIRLLGSYQSSLNHFSYRFEEGKIYHIDSDFGEGGWALTYLLSGLYDFSDQNIFHGEHIKYDEQEINSADELKKLACYVGTPDYNYYKAKSNPLWILNKHNYIISNILKNSYLVKTGKYSLAEFCETFQIDDLNDKNGRANRLLDHMSGTIWRYSIALGIANNKKIFCFPQMPKTFMFLISEDTIGWLYQELKKRKCIVLIPTKYPEYIKNVIDDSVNINYRTDL